MASTPDGIPIIPSKSFQMTPIMNNPVQQLANSTPPQEEHDIGYCIKENIFNKSRLDSSLEEQRVDRRTGKAANPNAEFNDAKADY